MWKASFFYCISILILIPGPSVASSSVSLKYWKCPSMVGSCVPSPTTIQCNDPNNPCMQMSLGNRDRLYVQITVPAEKATRIDFYTAGPFSSDKYRYEVAMQWNTIPADQNAADDHPSITPHSTWDYGADNMFYYGSRCNPLNACIEGYKEMVTKVCTPVTASTTMTLYTSVRNLDTNPSTIYVYAEDISHTCLPVSSSSSSTGAPKQQASSSSSSSSSSTASDWKSSSSQTALFSSSAIVSSSTSSFVSSAPSYSSGVSSSPDAMPSSTTGTSAELLSLTIASDSSSHSGTSFASSTDLSPLSGNDGTGLKSETKGSNADSGGSSGISQQTIIIIAAAAGGGAILLAIISWFVWKQCATSSSSSSPPTKTIPNSPSSATATHHTVDVKPKAKKKSKKKVAPFETVSPV